MASFNRAYKYLHRWEGGYVDHPSDPGGCTNHGISLRWYRRRVNPKATCDDIANLTYNDAGDLYEDYWWKGKLFYAIQSQDVADRFFSFTINMGPRNATRNLQRALNSIEDRKFEALKVDGLFGPKTLEATNSVFPKLLVEAYQKEVWSFYQRIIKRNPRLSAFRRGWKRRAFA